MLTAGTERGWNDCELELLGCVRLECVENTTGAWTFDSVTMFLVICCTCGRWTTPGMTAFTVDGATGWRSCCWPAEKQSTQNARWRIKPTFQKLRMSFYVVCKFTRNDCKFGPGGVLWPEGGNQPSATWQVWRSDNKALINTQIHITAGVCACWELS